MADMLTNCFLSMEASSHFIDECFQNDNIDSD